MNIFGLTTARLEIAQKGLDFASSEALVRAGNIANADTPGYRAKSYSFEEAMADALQPALRKTDQAHLPGTALGKTDGKVTESFASEKIDGNTVNMDTEVGALAEVDIRYGIYAAIAGGEIERMKDAILAR